MALSTAQKNEIHNRANAGESGSALAAEFGVSASAVSNLKNHYTPETVGGTVVPAKSVAAEVVPVAEKPAKKKAAVASTRTVVINSSKIINKSFEIPSNATFGEMLKICGEDAAVKGVFQGAQKARVTLEKSTDALPDTNGQPLYIFLTPVKTDAGGIC